MVGEVKKEQKPKRGDDSGIFEREIGKHLIKLFRESPEELWSYLPDIAAKIEKHLSPKKSSRGKDSPFYSYLTDREREFRLNSLNSIIDKSRGDGQITEEEAIKALEDAAALRDNAEDYKESLLSIAVRTLKLPLNVKEKQTVFFAKGKSEHHSYALIRGVNLSLTWGGKLIKIEIDPDELERRKKALSFVGFASDNKSDVAERHDSYFGDFIHA